jgi:predicted MPP superfamily phosphohydrolase
MMMVADANALFAVGPLSVLLFVVAGAGHLTLLVRIINWCYGAILSDVLNQLARVVLLLVAAGGPVLLWCVHGFAVERVLAAFWEGPGPGLLAAYVAVCLVLGAVVLPAITLRRLQHRPPLALLRNHTTTVDVAAQLGHRPVGRGKHRFLAHLPGNQIFQVDLIERTLRLPQLPPAWDGLTILQLTDLHMCGIPDRDYYRYILDRCNEWRPDLVALTGDVVDSDWHHRWIVPLLGRVHWRIAAFAILGNHDYWLDVPVIRRRLRRLGMHVLGNRWEKIEVRGEPLIVIGHEGPWFQPAPDMTNLPSEGFRLCLSHTPDNIVWAKQHRIDLMLSGHVHGGQVRLPLLGSVFVPSRYGRRYDCGTFLEPPTLLHVSRGLGGEHPLRYNCRPEVTRIILRKDFAGNGPPPAAG